MFLFTPGSRLGGLLVHRTPLRRLRASQARLVAALLAAVSVWLVASPLVKSLTARDVPVVVLRHTVGAGQALTAGDVTLAHYPAPLVPAGALRGTGDAVGRRLTDTADAGEPLTAARLTPTRSLAAGEVGVVLPVDPATAAALHAGDPARVLLTAGGSTATTAGTPVDVRILVVYPATSGRSLTAESSATTPVMVAARSQDANRFTGIKAVSSPIVLIRPYD